MCGFQSLSSDQLWEEMYEEKNCRWRNNANRQTTGFKRTGWKKCYLVSIFYSFSGDTTKSRAKKTNFFRNLTSEFASTSFTAIKVWKNLPKIGNS